MRRFFIIILLVPLVAIQFCTKQGEENIKVMTFNIRYGVAKDGPNSWEHRQPILFDCLKKYQPDILGIQESMEFQVDSIQAAFPHWKNIGVGRYFSVEAPDRPHESMKGESCRIFYDPAKFELIEDGTFWHSDTPDIPASNQWGNYLPRITTWGRFKSKINDKTFVVMNTHCHTGEPYVSKTAALMVRKWREIAGTTPTILMGDFNLGPTSDTHQLFCGKTGDLNMRGNFVDSWEILGKSEDSAGTGHLFQGIKAQERIDWILVTPEFDVKSNDIIYDNLDGRYPSDHFPVLAQLQYLW